VRVMIKAAAAAAVLLMAAPALAMTLESSPSPASLAGARFLNAHGPFAGPAMGLQAAVVGSGLRTDGGSEFSGDGAASYGYLTSAEPADSAKRGAERDFEDELTTDRVPGVTVHYATAPGGQVAPTLQGK
jgi:hypothetical protein